MKYNPILDQPPTEAVIGGRVYRVNTDFRAVLSYFRLAGDKEHTEDEKTFLTMRLFFGEEIYREDVPELFKWLQFFISRGEEPEATKGPVVFDSTVDAGRIFAAFFQVYKINLRAGKDPVHWWIFCELMEALPDGTHLAEVIRIRGRKFEKGMSPTDKNELQKAKNRYRIGEAVDPITAIFNSLRGAT